MAGYPPFQQDITDRAGQVDNPAWRQFFVRVGQLLTGAVTHVSGNLTSSHLILGNGGGDIRALSTLGSATTVLHGNAGGDPSWSGVSLTADVTGTLPVASGGTGVATLATNRVPYGNGTSPFQSATNFTFDGTTFTTAGQIAFPATQAPSSGVNVLDDYEEGDWTPVVGGSGGTSGQTYTLQLGKYIKIGRDVFAEFNVLLSNKGTITTDVQIQGLPFTIENTTNYAPSLHIGLWDTLGTAMVYVSGTGNSNTTTANLFGATAAAVSLAKLAAADIANTTRLTGFISYRATA